MPFLLQRYSGEAAREEKMTDEKDTKESLEKITGKAAERHTETDRELE